MCVRVHATWSHKALPSNVHHKPSKFSFITALWTEGVVHCVQMHFNEDKNDDNQNYDDIVYKNDNDQNDQNDEKENDDNQNDEEENDDNDNGNDEVPLLHGCTCKVASGNNGQALSRLNALQTRKHPWW